MNAPLKMAMIATLDASGVASGAAAAKASLAGIATQAKQTEGSLRSAVDASLGIGRTSGRDRGADIEAYGRELDKLRAKYNPLFAAQQKYRAELAEIRQAEKAGALSAQEAQAALQRSKTGFASYVVALNGTGAGLGQFSKNTKLAAHEMQQLSYQSIDIAQQLLSGQSFAMIMAQQSGQVAQILGKRGLGTIIPAIGQSFLSLVTPTTLFLAGITAGGYAAYGVYKLLRGEVLTVDEAMERLEGTLDRLETGYKGAADAAEEFLKKAKIPTIPEAIADLQTRQKEGVTGFERAQDDLFTKTILRTSGQNRRFIGQGLTTELRDLAEQFKRNLITVDEYATAIGKIRLRPDLSAPAKKLTDELQVGLETARKFAGEVDATAASISALKRISPAANGRVDSAFAVFEEKDALEKLRSDLERRVKEAGVKAVPVPGAKPVTIDLGTEGAETIRSQEQQLARLRLEAALIGQSDAARQRALAALDAEVEIRNKGIDAASAQADAIRDNARALADERTALDRSRAAWAEVGKTGGQAIDTLTDKVSSGDFEGALTGVADDLKKELLALSISNPLKNSLYGQSLPTLADAGGVSGFFKSLLGGGPNGLAASTMQVQAATVLINGQPLSGLSAFAGTGTSRGAQASASALASGRLAANDSGVEAQVWNFFRSKGLKDYQVAGILGNVKAESNFNPLAVGDGGKAFGLFQHNDRSGRLFDFLGGQQNLGNVKGQLDFAWRELMSTEGRAMKALLSSTDLKGATAAFGGFERPSGFSWGDPEGMHNWTGRLQAAEEALGRFGGGLDGSLNGLTRFDGGIGRALTSLADGSGSLANTATAFAGQSEGLASSLASGLKSIFSGAAGGGGGGGLGSLLGGLVSTGLKLFGFRSGGHTGAGADDEPAGLVHRNEFVIDAPAVRRIGVPTLEAMRKGRLPGYQSGGFVSGGYAGASQGAGASASSEPAPLSITFEDHAGVQVETREERDERGGRRIRFVLAEQMADGLTLPGGKARQTMRRTYGLQPRRSKR